MTKSKCSGAKVLISMPPGYEQGYDPIALFKNAVLIKPGMPTLIMINRAWTELKTCAA